MEDVKDNEKLKEEVLQKYGDINVDFDRWYDGVYEKWIEELKNYGFEDVKIYFSGFWTQGDGACFISKVNIVNFISAFKDEIIKELNITEKQLNLIIKLQENYDFLTYKIKQFDTHYYHEYTIKADYEYYLYPFQYHEKLYNFLEKTVYQLQDFITEKARFYSRKIYRDLENEYDYLTSENAILETLEINDYEFTEDGNIF
jgi:uncharacterized coiled-coil protein SlyX